MVRTQIQLTEEQSENVRRFAAEDGISKSDLIRKAVDELTTKRQQRELRARAMEAAGCFRSELGDLSEKHNEYAAEAYAE